MIALHERLLNQKFDNAIGDFIDEFRTTPSYDSIKDSILDLDLSPIDKSYAAGVVDCLCSEFQIQRPSWIFDPSLYLKEPYFAMNAKGSLRLILLKESPKWFRSRNVFVSANCMERT